MLLNSVNLFLYLGLDESIDQRIHRGIAALNDRLQLISGKLLGLDNFSILYNCSGLILVRKSHVRALMLNRCKILGIEGKLLVQTLVTTLAR